MEEFRQQITESKEQKLKRRLGFRDFPQRNFEEKKVLLGSNERVRALDAITTTTLPVSKREVKKGVVLEIAEKYLISSELLRQHPLVYIGSGTDIEYPLALGGRNIIMVDHILKDEIIQKEVVEKVRKLIEEEPIVSGQKIDFSFDFGNGKESVSVELVAKSYSPKDINGYNIPSNTGLIVLYASQGPSGTVSIDENMKLKLTEEGVILEETRIIKTEENKEKIIELGE